MKALIIENEENARVALKELLKAFCPEIGVIEEASGVASGLESIQKQEPDVLFLDVELEDGFGFEVIHRISQPKFQVIFTTAHDKYAVQAFKCSAIDYLLKPVDPDELKTAVKKAGNNRFNQDLKQQMTILMEQFTQKVNPEKRIVLKDHAAAYFVKVSDILYCEAAGTYTKFHLLPESIITVSKNLKEYEGILESMGFIRTHHAYLVNANKVKLFDKKEGGTLILENGANVPVSHRKKDVVLQLLQGMNE